MVQQQETLDSRRTAMFAGIFGRIANLKGHYFQSSLSVCLSVCVCVCVSDQHFYNSTLTDFDETWSQGPTLI